MSTMYAIGTPMGDATYTVRQSGGGEWQISGGLAYDNAPDGLATGYITQQWGTSEFRVDVDDSGAESVITGTLSDAVDAFASLTRMVEATEEGRTIARNWQSPGTVGSVLAQFASTGRARLDQLADDAERTERMDAGAAEDMAQLLHAGHGYREPITARSIAEDVIQNGGTEPGFEAIVTEVFSTIASTAPHLITDAESARLALDDTSTAFENADEEDPGIVSERRARAERGHPGYTD